MKKSTLKNNANNILNFPNNNYSNTFSNFYHNPNPVNVEKDIEFFKMVQMNNEKNENDIQKQKKQKNLNQKQNNLLNQNNISQPVDYFQQNVLKLSKNKKLQQVNSCNLIHIQNKNTKILNKTHLVENVKIQTNPKNPINIYQQKNNNIQFKSQYNQELQSNFNLQELNQYFNQNKKEKQTHKQQLNTLNSQQTNSQKKLYQNKSYDKFKQGKFIIKYEENVAFIKISSQIQDIKAQQQLYYSKRARMIKNIFHIAQNQLNKITNQNFLPWPINIQCNNYQSNIIFPKFIIQSQLKYNNYNIKFFIVVKYIVRKYSDIIKNIFQLRKEGVGIWFSIKGIWKNTLINYQLPKNLQSIAHSTDKSIWLSLLQKAYLINIKKYKLQQLGLQQIYCMISGYPCITIKIKQVNKNMLWNYLKTWENELIVSQINDNKIVSQNKNEIQIQKYERIIAFRINKNKKEVLIKNYYNQQYWVRIDSLINQYKCIRILKYNPNYKIINIPVSIRIKNNNFVINFFNNKQDNVIFSLIGKRSIKLKLILFEEDKINEQMNQFKCNYHLNFVGKYCSVQRKLKKGNYLLIYTFESENQQIKFVWIVYHFDQVQIKKIQCLGKQFQKFYKFQI